MQTFQIAQASMRALWLLPVVAIPLLIVAVVLAASVTGMRKAQFDVSADGLRLRGDLYGRTIAAPDLRAAEARRVDLSASGDLKPKWKTMGTALPGYRAGWFRLRNGEKALLYLTDFDKAVYIPTHLGYSVLVSPDNPDAFLTAIHTMESR
jgi:hypothetical protein